jgi:hypothetical protein
MMEKSELVKKINAAANQIAKATRTPKANYMIVSNDWLDVWNEMVLEEDRKQRIAERKDKIDNILDDE